MKSSINVLLLGLALADNVFLTSRIINNGICSCLRFYERGFQYDNVYQPFLFKPVLVCLLMGEFDLKTLKGLQYIYWG